MADIEATVSVVYIMPNGTKQVFTAEGPSAVVQETFTRWLAMLNGEPVSQPSHAIQPSPPPIRKGKVRTLGAMSAVLHLVRQQPITRAELMKRLLPTFKKNTLVGAIQVLVKKGEMARSSRDAGSVLSLTATDAVFDLRHANRDR